MNIAGGEKGVDARPFGALDAVPRRLDVAAGAAREATDDRRLGLRPARKGGLADFGGDGLHRRHVVRGGGGKAGLDHVNAKARELAGDLKLFGRGHGSTGSLLAIAEAGVENANVVGRRGIHGE